MVDENNNILWCGIGLIVMEVFMGFIIFPWWSEDMRAAQNTFNKLCEDKYGVENYIVKTQDGFAYCIPKEKEPSISLPFDGYSDYQKVN